MYLSYFDKFYDMEPYLSIEEKEWEYIKNTFEKQDVRESLAKVAMTYPPPYMNISENGAYKELQKLKGMRHNDLLVDGEWFAREGTKYRYDLTFEGKQQYFKRINTGNASSNYFQQENRWSVDGTIAPGPIRTWGSYKFMTTLMGAAYTLKLPKINKGALRVMISLRKYICSQFKPNVAKVLYDKLGSQNILDFSAGWGDRLAGFYGSESGKYYLGIDPRKENHPIYREQKEFYEKHRNMFFEVDKDCEFIESPAEDVDFKEYENIFDTVFTSPPYFSVERYSYEDTQSWVRYKEIDDWNKNFLQKTIENLWVSIKSGGYLLVNIADVFARTGTQRNMVEICNPMNDFLSTFSDSEYQGCIGMEMAKRPNSGGAGMARASDERFHGSTIKKAEETKDKRFCEPIWIWKKL
ncbi:site-specific DNA-methyltransferase [Candidatus Woesearchaeota archaeon]|nr:site-specific DNA-methyltransferase [Candidatus Woesearchaeota archaeon]